MTLFTTQPASITQRWVSLRFLLKMSQSKLDIHPVLIKKIYASAQAISPVRKVLLTRSSTVINVFKIAPVLPCSLWDRREETPSPRELGCGEALRAAWLRWGCWRRHFLPVRPQPEPLLWITWQALRAEQCWGDLMKPAAPTWRRHHGQGIVDHLWWRVLSVLFHSIFWIQEHIYEWNWSVNVNNESCTLNILLCAKTEPDRCLAT